MTDYDSVVVGGGIVGSATAYHLAREGCETLLIDRGDAGRATAAGAGIVFPATSSLNESPDWFEFALQAADHYPVLASELDRYDHTYTRPGLLAVAVDADEVGAFEESKRRAERRSDEHGHPRPGRFEEVSPERARELYPPLSEVERVMFYEDGARVDGQAFARSLRQASAAAGTTILDADVTRVLVERGTVGGVSTADGDTYSADSVVVAGGAWSPTLATDLGVDIPVEPQRGQIMHLDVGPIGCTRPTEGWPIVKAFRGHYQVPWPDLRVACGATRESGRGFEPHVTLGGLQEVSTEALRVASGMAEARHLETRVGLRPASADGLPIIGQVPAIEGAYLATGHGPTGLTLGPYSGRVVAELVLGETPEADISPFRVDRFQA